MRLWGVAGNVKSSGSCLTMFSLCSNHEHMAGSLRTLEEAARHRMVIVVHCRGCKREGRFLARDLAANKGWNKSPWGLKFRCTGCQGTDMKIELEFFDPDPRGVHIIWKPVEVKGQ